MKKLFLSVAAAILAFPVLADEGMWLLPLLKQQKFAEMQALGLRLSDQEVYSAEAPSLKDAVVRFGGGCTGEMLSPDGLVLVSKPLPVRQSAFAYISTSLCSEIKIYIAYRL